MTRDRLYRVVWRVWLKSSLAAIFIATGFQSGSLARSAEPLPDPPPFYPDKMELLVWRDDAGNAHPVRDARAWKQRREHILANMQVVMGPLPQRGRDVPLDVQIVATEKLPTLTRQSWCVSPTRPSATEPWSAGPCHRFGTAAWSGAADRVQNT